MTGANYCLKSQWKNLYTIWDSVAPLPEEPVKNYDMSNGKLYPSLCFRHLGMLGNHSTC